MNKHLILLSFLFAVICFGFIIKSQGQSSAKVENINFYAEGTKLIITFDIVKAKPVETFDIWIKIVTVSGREISPITMTGNIGSGNTGGTGKRISWDVEADRVTLDEEFSVEVFARPEKKEEVKAPAKEKTEPVVIPVVAGSMKAADVFIPEKNTFYWLGLDFSHLKLIGDFTQFGEAGSIDPYQIKTQYFPGWNNLMLSEPDKYDFKGMFQLNELVNDIEMITKVNAETDVNTMEGSSAPNYSLENIQSFVNGYNTTRKSGIGIVFIAEAFDKNTPEAWFHVVAINASSKEVLVCERVKAKPGGFGLRNYWAAAVYNIIKEGKKSYYKSWKTKYLK